MPYVVFIASPTVDELTQRQKAAPDNARKLTVRARRVFYKRCTKFPRVIVLPESTNLGKNTLYTNNV